MAKKKLQNAQTRLYPKKTLTDARSFRLKWLYSFGIKKFAYAN
jgi:hypothetical protein